MRFGKHAPKHDYRTFLFPSYAAGLADPPPAYDSIKHWDPKQFPMDGNDTLGDCTIAAIAHAITVWSHLIGHRKRPSTSSVIKLYRHLTGGEDTGLNMLDVLNYLRKHSFDGDKILAFAKLNSRNHKHVKQAIQIFGGVFTGFQCQEKVIDDFNAGRKWTPGRLTQDGHAIFTHAYDGDCVSSLTWGSTQLGTWDWWDECVDEAYVILPPEAKQPSFAPGFDVKQLEADLQMVATV
jgi:hypothetical protein